MGRRATRSTKKLTIPYFASEFDITSDLRRVAVAPSLAVADMTEAVEVFDFDSGQVVNRFDGLKTLREAPVTASSYTTAVSFSPDSKKLLMAGILSTVMADVTTGEERLIWYDGESHAPVSEIGFDSTGAKIILGSGNSGYKVLDANTFEPLVVGFTGRTANRPQFNPTQPLVMTDGGCTPPIPAEDPLMPLELWDAAIGDDIGTTGWRLNCGFWYPNGMGFVGYENRIEFWDLDPEQWVQAACRFAGRNLTQDEWDRYGPKDTYRETCP